MKQRAEVTQTQARIMIYLSMVHKTRKHPTAIGAKLNIDYSYLMRVLPSMEAKGWLLKHKYLRHTFYDLSPNAPLELAKKCLLNEDLAQSIIGTYLETEDYLLAERKSDENDKNL